MVLTEGHCTETGWVGVCVGVCFEWVGSGWSWGRGGTCLRVDRVAKMRKKRIEPPPSERRGGFKRVKPTLLSLIQEAVVCCLSIISRTLRYQLSVLSLSVIVEQKMWFQTLSSFWHCSRSFFELLCADLNNSFFVHQNTCSTFFIFQFNLTASLEIGPT